MYKLVKQNKRLVVVDDDNNIVYCPPDFLRPVTSRDDYMPMIEEWNNTGIVGGQVLTDFETKFNPRLYKK